MTNQKSYSVTDLIKILNKPGLLYWANNIGLSGLSLHEQRNKLAKKGTKKHNEIQDFFVHGVDFKDSYKLKESIKGYDVYSCEEDLSNGYIHGRSDLILLNNGKKIVCDFKSGSKIYLSTKLQLTAYKELSKSDEIAFISMDDYKLITIDIDHQKYLDIIKYLYKIKINLDTLNEKL